MARLVIISGEEARQKSAEELFSELGTGPQGLSGSLNTARTRWKKRRNTLFYNY